MWKTGYRPLNVYRNLESGGAVRRQGEIGWLFSTFSIANCNNPKSLKWIKLLNHQIRKSLILITNHNPSSTHWKCSKSPRSVGELGVAHQGGGGRRRVVYPVLRRLSNFIFLSQSKTKKHRCEEFQRLILVYRRGENRCQSSMPAHFSVLR